MEQNTCQRDPLKSILQNFSLYIKEPVIGILRRNPFQIFVYWELPTLSKKRRDYFLRIIDTSEKEEWKVISLINIEINNNRCYVDIPVEVKSLEAEIVGKTDEGEEEILISTIKEEVLRNKIVPSKEKSIINTSLKSIEPIIFCEIQKPRSCCEEGSTFFLPREKTKDKIIISSSWSGKRS